MSAQPVLTESEEIEKAIQESLKLQAPVDILAIEGCRNDHAKRDVIRYRAIQTFKEVQSPPSVGKQLMTLAAPTDGIAGISELFFFVRFFWPYPELPPESSTFFCDPTQGKLTLSEESTFSLLLECQPSGQTPKRSYLHAWRTQLESRLANMTACGHLADSLLDKIFFASSQERDQHTIWLSNRDSPVTEVVDSFLRFLETATPDSESFVVRVEVANCHVLLIEIPSSRAECYRIESAIRIYDAKVTIGSAVKLISDLRHHGSLDKFEVFRYERASAHQRICDAYSACFDSARLAASVSCFSSEESTVVKWIDLLDAVYILNHISKATPQIWHTPLLVFEQILRISSPLRS